MARVGWNLKFARQILNSGRDIRVRRSRRIRVKIEEKNYSRILHFKCPDLKKRGNVNLFMRDAVNTVG